MWRSPVAQRSGGPEVASSNLVIPTSIEGNGNVFISFFYVFPQPFRRARFTQNILSSLFYLPKKSDAVG